MNMPQQGPMVQVNLPPAKPGSTMPESSWRWRRIFTFAVTLFVSVMVWKWGDRLADIAAMKPEVGIPALVTVVKWVIITQIVYSLNYLVGPTAEHIVQMVQVGRSLRGGVLFQSSAGQSVAGPAPEARDVAVPSPPVPPSDDNAGLPENLR